MENNSKSSQTMEEVTQEVVEEVTCPMEMTNLMDFSTDEHAKEDKPTNSGKNKEQEERPDPFQGIFEQDLRAILNEKKNNHQTPRQAIKLNTAAPKAIKPIAESHQQRQPTKLTYRMLMQRQRATKLQHALHADNRPLRMENSKVQIVTSRGPNATVSVTADTKSDAAKTVRQLVKIAYRGEKRGQLKIFLQNLSDIAKMVGKKGVHLNEIRTDTGAKIILQDNYANASDERLITIQGAEDNMIMALRRIMDYCGQYNSYIRLYNPFTEDPHPESWGGYTSEEPPKLVRAINNASCVFEPRSEKTTPTTSTYLKRVMHANNIPGREHRTIKERPTILPSNSDFHKNDKPTRGQYGEKRRHPNPKGDEGEKRHRHQQCPATVTSATPKSHERGVTTEEVKKMMENMKADILQAIQGNKTKQNESSDVMAPLNSTPIRQITNQLRPKRKPKIYVFGESHIHRKNDCDLQSTIPSLNVDLAEYV